MSSVPVSVIMPAYNSGPYIADAIQSVLNQSFTDYELIIINDGSADETEAVVNSFSDGRIRYFANEKNMGNAWTRNKGMDLAAGKYITMMDSDDIAAPDWLSSMHTYMESHADVGFASGKIIFFYPDHWFLRHYPTDAAYIKSFLFFKNCLVQACSFLRRETFLKNGLRYDTSSENGEDYDLWYRAAMSGIKMVSVKKILLYHRRHAGQLTDNIQAEKWTKNLQTMFRYKLKSLDIQMDEPGFLQFFSFINGRTAVSDKDKKNINNWLNNIEEANNRIKLFPARSFRAVLLAHRLRLAKYYFLEKGRSVAFFFACIRLGLQAGAGACLLFWNNEGRYGGSFGADKKNTSPIHTGINTLTFKD